MIHDLKSSLSSRDLPFGVDLALPAVGGTARKTNHDYTKGLLNELIDVIIEEKTKLFVSAVGVPPKNVIERLHEGGVVVMNMVGHPKHAVKAFEAGVDIVCAQGGDGVGHTGEISMNLLVSACVDVAKQYRPKMLGGREGLVVAAGGIWDGRGLAAALGLGTVGVWVGTRFVASEEAGCSQAHKDAVVEAGWGDTTRTLVVSKCISQLNHLALNPVTIVRAITPSTKFVPIKTLNLSYCLKEHSSKSAVLRLIYCTLSLSFSTASAAMIIRLTHSAS